MSQKNKATKKTIHSFCKAVKKMLPGSQSLKRAFIVDFQNRIEEYMENNDTDTICEEDIIAQFGTPEDIAQSFYDRDNLLEIRKKAKKYCIYKVLAISSIVLLILAAILLAVMLTKDNNIYITDDFSNTSSAWEFIYEKMYST